MKVFGRKLRFDPEVVLGSKWTRLARQQREHIADVCVDVQH